MNDHFCIRCQHPVLLEDGHLVYCSHCGAPQIFLAEELQAQIAESAREYAERNAPGPQVASDVEAVPVAPSRRWSLPKRRPGDPSQTAWPLATQYALFSAAIALALGLLSLLLPPVSILMLLWAVAAPILTVAFYVARSGGTPPPDSGFAAKLGLLTGLLVAVCCAVVFTLQLVMARYVFHDAGLLDAQLAASFDQQRTVALQRFGASVQPTLDMFALPEFRVGVVLTVVGISAAAYVFLSTVAAGVAGLFLRRRPNP